MRIENTRMARTAANNGDAVTELARLALAVSAAERELRRRIRELEDAMRAHEATAVERT